MTSSHSKVLQPDSNIESKERLEHQFFSDVSKSRHSLMILVGAPAWSSWFVQGSKHTLVDIHSPTLDPHISNQAQPSLGFSQNFLRAHQEHNHQSI